MFDSYPHPREPSKRARLNEWTDRYAGIQCLHKGSVPLFSRGWSEQSLIWKATTPSLETRDKCVCPNFPKIGTSRINVIRRVCYSVTQNYFPLAITQGHLYASVYRSAHIAVRPSGQFLKTAAEQANNWELVRWQASFTNERADDANTEALYFIRNSGAQGHKSFVIDCKILPSVPPPSNAIQSRSASFFLIRTFQTKLRDKGDLTSETTSIFSGRS